MTHFTIFIIFTLIPTIIFLTLLFIYYCNILFAKISFLETNGNNFLSNYNKKIYDLDSKIEILVKKLYATNKYYIINIHDDYKINYMMNYCIVCSNLKNIEIKLPEKNDKNIVGSIIYIKNNSNYNVQIKTELKCLTNNLLVLCNNFLVRPKNIIKIIMLNKESYLIIKI